MTPIQHTTAATGAGPPGGGAALADPFAEPFAEPVAEAFAGAGADPRLSRVLRFIEAHLEDPALGADMLQSVSHVSRPTLYRMFGALGGVSRYIRERRLLAAHRRLHHDPGASITFLLYDLGFESERQFQRAFHAYFGMSPAQWRERCRARREN